ncbi:hypothetical protein B7755_005995 [Streptomyces sp. NBS 14/10]|uniref:hypothetical protein n=1 Tax=Streptomyces sp. NBS 14/10 TaxID=1945643 RepID=UPI0015C5C851|nr:hypothetical protein [Streptomyces sp. NBS 14/10]KAK1177763.1 hypothetical protein B7755_005995 [Streptomyces sp. NBS 14/10]NUS89882.1 hypothetical protein [Streptomyces sp.]
MFEEPGDQRRHAVEGPVHGRQADAEQVGKLPVGEVGPPRDGGRQNAVVQQERLGPPAPRIRQQGGDAGEQDDERLDGQAGPVQQGTGARGSPRDWS